MNKKIIKIHKNKRGKGDVKGLWKKKSSKKKHTVVIKSYEIIFKYSKKKDVEERLFKIFL